MSGDPWQPLAEAYAANRTGYSSELYDTIAAFGLKRGQSILDVACGTGIAAAPFAANGFRVTGVDASEAMLAQARNAIPGAEFVQGTAENLPFQAGQFDVAISAQAFHWFNRAKALAEIERVLRRGGMVAIWWKHLMAQDTVGEIRRETFQSLGVEPPVSGLSGGFREFYGSAGLFDQTLRVLPWRTAMAFEQFMGYERSRRAAREALGEKAERYFTELERRLHERFGAGNPTLPLAYMQYLYLAKKR